VKYIEIDEIYQKTTEKAVECTFLAADVLGDLENVTGTFDFAYDWELLHHIFPEQRQRHVANVHRLLNPKGKYLSLCFSERDLAFGGVGKYRRTPLGTVLYFSSEGELRALFDSNFRILICGPLKCPANLLHISPAAVSWSGKSRFKIAGTLRIVSMSNMRLRPIAREGRQTNTRIVPAAMMKR
jgi:SAM-dependent methyltransferase